MRAQFGPFSIDAETRQLFHGEAELRLSPKAFDLLCLLIEERPKVVERRELHARIWPDTHVVDANLNVLVAEIRRTLGDSASQPRFVRTVHGVGFSFCASVTREQKQLDDRRGMRCWLVSSAGTFRLEDGENVLGRDPQCDVFLDAPGVSRRHASIRIDSRANAVLLQDLGSTNGTFVRGAQVVEATPLRDADVITIGQVELTVRLRSSDPLPETQRIRR